MMRGGRAWYVPGGSGINAEKMKSWSTSIVDAWRAAGHAGILGGPVSCGIIFRLPMRAGDMGAHGPKLLAPFWSRVKPDIDKLVRSTLDALTVAGAWSDDSQVAAMQCAKVYLPPGFETGATIILGDPVDMTRAWDLWTTEIQACAITMKAAKEAGTRRKK